MKWMKAFLICKKRGDIMVSNFALKAIHSRMETDTDLFICFASFETRCLSIASNLDIERIRHAIIYYNEDCGIDMQDNIDKLKEVLGSRKDVISLYHKDPLRTADKIKASLENVLDHGTIKCVWLDITTFTHESLLMILKLLKLVYPVAKIICMYANAREYDPGNLKKEKWLSKGICEIRSVLGYSGNLLPTQKLHLLLIVGYEYERALSIINALEPTSISLGFGTSENAVTEKDSDANEYYKDLVEEVAKNYAQIDRFPLPCNDPFAACEAIVKKIDELHEKNILIVPLNNKITTVGAAMAAMERENAQICYAPATLYNYKNYSIPGSNCYMFEINESNSGGN